jgi:hypothetical protein
MNNNPAAIICESDYPLTVVLTIHLAEKYCQHFFAGIQKFVKNDNISHGTIIMTSTRKRSEREGEDKCG